MPDAQVRSERRRRRPAVQRVVAVAAAELVGPVAPAIGSAPPNPARLVVTGAAVEVVRSAAASSVSAPEPPSRVFAAGGGVVEDSSPSSVSSPGPAGDAVVVVAADQLVRAPGRRVRVSSPARPKTSVGMGTLSVARPRWSLKSAWMSVTPVGRASWPCRRPRRVQSPPASAIGSRLVAEDEDSTPSTRDGEPVLLAGAARHEADLWPRLGAGLTVAAYARRARRRRRRRRRRAQRPRTTACIWRLAEVNAARARSSQAPSRRRSSRTAHVPGGRQRSASSRRSAPRSSIRARRASAARPSDPPYAERSRERARRRCTTALGRRARARRPRG